MKKPNTIEAELNVTRLKLYEETKGMTPEEEIAYLKEKAASVHAKYNIRTVSRLEAVKYGN